MSSDWFWEGNVVAAIVKHLDTEGWEVTEVADTASKTRGIDIRATLVERVLLIECKGFPSHTYQDPLRQSEAKRTPPSVQAPHWYAQALLKAIQLQSEYPNAEVALGFPKHLRYLTLLNQTAHALYKLGIHVYLVGEDGTVQLFELFPDGT